MGRRGAPCSINCLILLELSNPGQNKHLQADKKSRLCSRKHEVCPVN